MFNKCYRMLIRNMKKETLLKAIINLASLLNHKRTTSKFKHLKIKRITIIKLKISSFPFNLTCLNKTSRRIILLPKKEVIKIAMEILFKFNHIKVLKMLKKDRKVRFT